MLCVQTHSFGLVFKVHVLPRSSCNQVVGLHGDALKMKLTAPPVEGKANTACIEFLSKALGITKSSLEIISGHSSHQKAIRLMCSSSHATLIRKRLEDLSAG